MIRQGVRSLFYREKGKLSSYFGESFHDSSTCLSSIPDCFRIQETLPAIFPFYENGFTISGMKKVLLGLALQKN